jgi:hypothetical protein
MRQLLLLSLFFSFCLAVVGCGGQETTKQDSAPRQSRVPKKI